MHWSERLRALIKDKGWSDAEAARRIGIPYDRLRKYVTGSVDNPRGDTFEQLAKPFGRRGIWLEHGYDTEPKADDPHSISLRRIPLFQMEDIEGMEEVQRNPVLSKSHKSVVVPHDIGPRAFGVVIPDDALEGQLNAGDIAVIDPDAKPIPGKLVLAMVGSSPLRAVVRRYAQKTKEVASLLPEASQSTFFPEEQVSKRKGGRIIGRAVLRIQRL